MRRAAQVITIRLLLQALKSRTEVNGEPKRVKTSTNNAPNRQHRAIRATLGPYSRMLALKLSCVLISKLPFDNLGLSTLKLTFLIIVKPNKYKPLCLQGCCSRSNTQHLQQALHSHGKGYCPIHSPKPRSYGRNIRHRSALPNVHDCPWSNWSYGSQSFHTAL